MKVFGGWLVRAFVKQSGAGTGPWAQSECSAFVPDPLHAWPAESAWERLVNRHGGDVSRMKTPTGWLVLSTAMGSMKDGEGDRFSIQVGSIVFIPDAQHEWECEIIQPESGRQAVPGA